MAAVKEDEDFKNMVRGAVKMAKSAIAIEFREDPGAIGVVAATLVSKAIEDKKVFDTLRRYTVQGY